MPNRTDAVEARKSQLDLLVAAGQRLREAESYLRRAAAQADIVAASSPGYGAFAERKFADQVSDLRRKVSNLHGRRSRERNDG